MSDLADETRDDWKRKLADRLVESRQQRRRIMMHVAVFLISWGIRSLNRQGGSMSDTDTLSELDLNVEVIPYEDTEDGKDHLTHIVNPPNNTHIWQPGMSAQDIVTVARLTGQEVESLCGYRWVPKRNPEKYPVCQACMDIAGNLMRGASE